MVRFNFRVKQYIFVFISTFLLLPQSGFTDTSNYFHQKVSYEIDVKLNDKLHELEGFIKISYTNNSPDTLSYIWMHLWPDAYRDNNSALSKQSLGNQNSKLYFAKDAERGRIDNINFKVNNISVAYVSDAEYSDMGKIILAQPLKPGETILITSPFKIKIPAGKFSRLGHIGSSYQLTQWYPKPAVYDNSGWHQMPYLDQGEFYSEFGKFKVSITLPENYVVAATGVLQDESEKEWLEKKIAATKSISEFGKDITIPISSETYKTITFIQDSIHDFAWFADKRFHVLKESFKLKNSEKTVEAWIFFTNHEADLWKNALSYIREGIVYFSEKVGDYPYSHFTAVDGTFSSGGGMEYPMITLLNTSGDAFTLEDVIVHELGHSWFYGILGFNERKEGWLDEGLTSYYELEYVENKYKGENSKGKNDLGANNKIGSFLGLKDFTFKEGFDITYNFSSFNNSDQPINTKSEEFTSTNYGTVMYRKAALAFDFLNDYLGDETFSNSMKQFYERWKYKHSGALELENVFEEVSGKDLDWFFKRLVGNNGASNYTIRKINNDDNRIKLLVENCGTVDAPLQICDDQNYCEWFEGFLKEKEISYSNQNSKFVTINKNYSTLLKSKPAKYNLNSVFKKQPNFRITLKPDFSRRSDKLTLVKILPVAGWNHYNRWMGGLYLSNISIIPKQFEFNFVPLYDFRSEEFAGIGSLEYNVWPTTGLFNNISATLSGKRFAYFENRNLSGEPNIKNPVFNYSKVGASLLFNFRKKTPRSTISQSIIIRDINIWLDEVEYVLKDSNYTSNFITSRLNYNDLSYHFRNDRKLDPLSSIIKLEQGPNHLKLSGEFNYKFSYAKYNKGIDVRFYAGGFLINDETERNYNFRMSGWEGSRDYLFDEIYFGRTDATGILSQQFVVREGGFKVPTFVGQSNKWIAAINLYIDVPFPLPVKFFFDIGTYEGISTVFPDIKNKVMYDGGLCVSLGKDVFEIYFPFIKSEDIKRNLDTIDLKFREQIRFVFNLNKLSPVHLRNSLIN